MSATDDGGADRSTWTGWLARLMGAPAAGRDAVPAAGQTGDLVQAPPDIALLDAVISGMPDPVVVLDPEGRVVAFNAEAATLAPALRRGGPASIALRTPELVEAIRAAGSTGKVQRVEFSSRLPSPRWSEAFVAPVAAAGHTRIYSKTRPRSHRLWRHGATSPAPGRRRRRAA